MIVGISSRDRLESSLAVDFAVLEMEKISVWREVSSNSAVYLRMIIIQLVTSSRLAVGL